MQNTKEIIRECKQWINNDDIFMLQESIQEIKNMNSKTIDIPNMYTSVFLYACYRNNIQAIELLNNEYKNFDEILKIALRQMFFHGKYLLNKNNREWYDQFILKEKRITMQEI